MPLLNNPRGSKLLVLVFILLFTLGLATKCSASEAYTQMAYGRTMIRGETSVLDFQRTIPLQSRAAVREDAEWRIGMTLIGSSMYGSTPEPGNFRVKLQYVEGLGQFHMGLGVSVGQNVDDFNGSILNFALTAEWRFKRWPVTLALSHDSNAGTRMPNVGRDYLLLGWRFQ